MAVNTKKLAKIFFFLFCNNDIIEMRKDVENNVKD